MIGSLRGSVLERLDDGRVLIEVGGIGYLVTVTPRTLAELEPTSPVFLYIHHHIREDAQTLFGFLRRDERSAFDILIATHGIGPALAVAILGTHTPTALVDIVAGGVLAREALHHVLVLVGDLGVAAELVVTRAAREERALFVDARHRARGDGVGVFG